METHLSKPFSLNTLFSEWLFGRTHLKAPFLQNHHFHRPSWRKCLFETILSLWIYDQVELNLSKMSTLPPKTVAHNATQVPLFVAPKPPRPRCVQEMKIVVVCRNGFLQHSLAQFINAYCWKLKQQKWKETPLYWHNWLAHKNLPAR